MQFHWKQPSQLFCIPFADVFSRYKGKDFSGYSQRCQSEKCGNAAITLAIAMSAKYLRQVRATVLDELSKDYVAGAKARGVKFSVTLWKSIMKASLVTIITLLMLSVGNLLGGTVNRGIYFHVGRCWKDGCRCYFHERLSNYTGLCNVDGNYLCSCKPAYRSVLPVPGSENSSGRCEAVSEMKDKMQIKVCSGEASTKNEQSKKC